MIHFRPGSQVYRLVTLLSVVGEFPMRSIHLLGNERVLKTLIGKLTSFQLLRFDNGEETGCRLLTIAGRGAGKAIRLYKGALFLLSNFSASEYYMNAFWGHRFPGDDAHRERNFRIAEAVAMCMAAQIEARPYCLPALQNERIAMIVPAAPSFYPSRSLKQIGNMEMNKTMYSRMAGAIFTPGKCYAVYNTRGAAMKWNGMGEFKARHNLSEIGRLNAGIGDVESAVLFGESYEVALRTLTCNGRGTHPEQRFDSVYRHIHFVPLDGFGIRLLRILTHSNPDGILSLLFPPELRSMGQGVFEYDAYIDGVYVLSHLDGDVARLIRFREAIEGQRGRFEVVCFAEQKQFLHSYLGELATIKIIKLGDIEDALGLERR